ncbi:hypothetical protein B0H14DRAFT_2644754 [Mycena olivaceomarginata]|nr:hypothetical protein B0H14DRAFT_2644754 [Mycena olivaceomarginata]
MPADTIRAQLKGLHSSWCRDTNITIKTTDELKVYLERTKNYVVEFHEHKFKEMFDGEVYHFRFFYRNPWDWLLDLVSDPTLANNIVWYPSRNTLSSTEINNASATSFGTGTNGGICSILPVVAGIPHCVLLLLAWLDKGRVSSHTNMHPIIFRSLSLPSAIWNGSGNGGRELGGFMVQVQDRKDPDNRSQSAKILFAKFKRDIYHRVLQVIFVETMKQQASGGKCVPCGDAVDRVLFPRIPILSLDGEEACTCAATRSSLADFPCPCCLVHQDQLHNFFSTTLEFLLRTTVTMKAIYEQAQSECFKGAAEDLLQCHGLHSTENTFWSLEGSDPYEAISYDTLHADDTGKWGKHLWPLLQDTLPSQHFSPESMSKVPRWPGLKHFANVTTKDINDGQSWLDIEKMTSSSARMLTRKSMGNSARYFFHCPQNFVLTALEKLNKKYNKSFDYPKQHALWHSTPDICAKGPHSIYCTWIKEGFHQETREIYRPTPTSSLQMTSLDAIREAMAHVWITVNQYDAEISDRITALAKHADDLTFSDSALPMPLPPLHVPRELDGLLRHIAVQCLFPVSPPFRENRGHHTGTIVQKVSLAAKDPLEELPDT